jgi:hypothetical protein
MAYGLTQFSGTDNDRFLAREFRAQLKFPQRGIIDHDMHKHLNLFSLNCSGAIFMRSDIPSGSGAAKKWPSKEFLGRPSTVHRHWG